MSDKESIGKASKGHLDLWLVGLITLAGTVLRIWRSSKLGLVHFDEGVYAMSGLWGVTPWRDMHFYAKQILFSPPIFVFLVGISYRLLGAASDQAALLVSVVMGAATIVLVWWIARQWFGPMAAIAAAALTALSNYQVAYSRMALTDVTFGFFLLLSLAFIALTLETGSFGWAFLSGLAVGAAWNTKYHGWLPLLMALLVVLAFAVTGRLERSHLKRLLRCWLIMAVVATICYLPWAAYIQTKPGGYFAFAKYQRKFLSPHWFQNLFRQAKMQLYFEGWLSRFSPAVSSVFCWAISRDRMHFSRGAVSLAILLLLGSGFVFGGAGTVLGLTILAIPMLAQSRRYSSAFLLSSLSVLFLLMPLYKPYPRLALPFLLSAYIAAGAGMQRILTAETMKRNAHEARFTNRTTLAFAAVGCLAIMGFFVRIRPAPRTWMATDSVHTAVTDMTALLPEDSTVFVHGAPEVAFYFKCAGRTAVPIDHMIDHPDLKPYFDRAGDQYFLVTGIYSRREPGSRASLERLARHLRLLGEFPIQPNDERLLNDFDPSGALQYRLHPTKEYALRLYEIDPAAMRQGMQ